jgi:hypothetical protein
LVAGQARHDNATNVIKEVPAFAGSDNYRMTNGVEVAGQARHDSRLVGVPAFAGSDNYRMTSVVWGKEIPARGPESYSLR